MTHGEGFVMIHPSAKPRIPWANGRGYTRELAHDASRSWRLSIADIGQHAPFSALPGIDRILLVAAGEALLRIDGVEQRLAVGASVAFTGESEASAEAVGDAALFVNLMMVRGETEFDSHGALTDREIALPSDEDELVIVLSPGVTVDGVHTEAGTVLMLASADTVGATSSARARFLRFRQPVLVRRLTRRRPQ